MTVTEVKKAFYKGNHIAKFEYIQFGTAFYNAEIDDTIIKFQIPVSDMGDGSFESEIPAKLLNRWITDINKK